MSGARIAQPEVTFNNVPAKIEVGNTAHRVLAVGLMASSGASATAGALVTNILNDNSESDLFGNSQLADMITNFKKINKMTRIDAIGVAEPSGGAAATATITVTNAATKVGDITLEIGDSTGVVKVSGAVGDDPTKFAKKISDAVTAAADGLPVTATVAAGVVTLTANQKGIQGNFLGLKISGSVPGLDIEITKFSTGAGSLDLTTVFDAVKKERYQTIIWPFESDVETVKDFLEPRWNVKNNILDGVAVTCSQNTFAHQLAEVKTMNEKSIVYLCNGTVTSATYNGGMIFTSPHNIAAQFCAMRALRYTDGSVLTPYLTTNAGLDQYGGPGIAALPYFNTLMPYLPTVEQGQGYDDTEIEQLLDAGGSVLGNNPSGTDVICGEVVTTYKTDPAGNKDVSYKFLNYVDEASIVREYFWLNIRKRFSQCRLTNGPVIPGRSMVNEGVVRSYCGGLYGNLAGPDYCILQYGSDYLEYFKDNLQVSLNLANGRITILAKLCYVTQAREFVGTLEMVFDINGGQ